MSEAPVETKEQELLTPELPMEWKRYFEQLSEARLKEVTRLAKLDDFSIDIYNEKKGVWDTKIYKYQEIPASKWIELEKLRSEYGDLEKMAATKLLDRNKESYEFTSKLTALNAEIYTRSAKFFLGMNETDFGNAQWIQIRNIIDACNHRTVYSLPN